MGRQWFFQGCLDMKLQSPSYHQLPDWTDCALPLYRIITAAGAEAALILHDPALSPPSLPHRKRDVPQKVTLADELGARVAPHLADHRQDGAQGIGVSLPIRPTLQYNLIHLISLSLHIPSTALSLCLTCRPHVLVSS